MIMTEVTVRCGPRVRVTSAAKTSVQHASYRRPKATEADAALTLINVLRRTVSELTVSRGLESPAADRTISSEVGNFLYLIVIHIFLFLYTTTHTTLPHRH